MKTLALRPAERRDLFLTNHLVWRALGVYLVRISEEITPDWYFRATVIEVLEPGLFQVGKTIAVFVGDFDDTSDWWTPEGQFVPHEVPA